MITRNRKSVLSTVAPATGGTQSNELQAAIKSVTSSTDVGAVFLYDTSQDSDGGKWRSKCKGLSWFDEASSATRSARSEFPAMALIVADNDSGGETLTIYDLDDPAMPVWMVFQSAGSLTWATSGAVTIESVYALNGRIYVGHEQGSVGFIEYNFPADDSRLGNSTAYQLTSGRTIAERNTTSSWATGGDGYVIVNATVNDVAATWLEGGELDSMGLVRPVIACATDGGVSVIHPSGDVYDIQGGVAAYDVSESVAFTDNGKLMYSHGASTGNMFFVDRTPIPYADETWSDGAATADGKKLVGGGAMLSWGTPISALTEANSDDAKIFVPMEGDTFAVGNTVGLNIANVSSNNPRDGSVAHITSTYNTGYMVGDIRGAWLANSNALTDRSVKGNSLSLTGGIDIKGVDGLSTATTTTELLAYSGFSATDYLSQAYDADFDFGTGDFSIMLWAKWTADGSNSQHLVDRGTSAARLLIYDPSSNGNPQLYVASTSGGSATITTTSTFNDGSWHQVVALRRSSKLYIYVDGVDAQTTSVASTQNLDNSAGALNVGVSFVQSGPFNGSLSLLRISKTAPTPSQIKAIFDEEKVLFAAGARCLLQSDGGSPNAINDLAFDKSTGLLHAYQNGSQVAENRFRGLEMVESYGGYADGWSAASAAHGSVAGGVKASARTSSTGGVLVDLPSVDVRASLLEGESKIPDDGKFHFSGVTTDATPTVIGFIPIADNEAYNLVARVEGARYDLLSSGWNIFGEIKQSFYRNLGGDVAARDQASKLVSEGTAALDFELVTTTGGSDSPASIAATSNYIMLKVTGTAAVDRMQWKASVEVQRISEKTYER